MAYEILLQMLLPVTAVLMVVLRLEMGCFLGKLFHVDFLLHDFQMYMMICKQYYPKESLIGMNHGQQKFIDPWIFPNFGK